MSQHHLYYDTPYQSISTDMRCHFHHLLGSHMYLDICLGFLFHSIALTT